MPKLFSNQINERIMESIERNREKCLAILKEFTQNESLLRHAYAVETCVRAYAEKFGEDIEYWGNVALLHDFDYEKFPTAEEHPFMGEKILCERGFGETFTKAIISHANYSGEPRDTILKKTLFACDELAGFITAVAYVRPSKTVDEVEVKSVLKKMKDKAFARQVSRDDIQNGAKELNLPLEEHIQFCINAMKRQKNQLGL